MKRLLFLLFFGLCVAHSSEAQVKIGDNPQNINASSVLELESTDKVLVITRVTTAQMNAIVPLQGAMVYNTDLQSVHYYDGTQWVNIGGGDGGEDGQHTAEALVNVGSDPTIIITPTANGDNFEVAPGSIGSAQIATGGINGTTDILNGSIGNGKFGEDVITQFELSENSVGAIELDNDNIGVSAFSNDVGYITSANVVSNDPNNALQIGADNGAFYDESPLINAIQDNTDAIALDNDQSASNEIQNLTLTGSVIGLSDTAGTIDIGPLVSGGGSDDQNIGPVTLGPTNILSIGIEGGMAGTVDLNSLAGGGGSTEIADQTTITGIGTTGDPFKIEPGGNGQFLSTDAGGAVAWTTVTPGGGGTTEEVDGTLLVGAGTNADPFTIAPGGADQILRTNSAGDALAWVDLPTGSAAITDASIDGDGSSAATALSLADDAVNTDKIAPGGADQILRTNTAGDAVAWVDLPTGSAAITDASIDGDGSSAATALSLADDAVNTDKIAPGGADQILRTNTAGDAVAWVDLPTESAVITDATIDGDGSSATMALSLADNAVTLPKIAPNGATDDGDIIQWNTDVDGLGNAGWEVVPNAEHTGDPKSIFFAGADGKPRQFVHPGTLRPSLYWDYEGRTLGTTSYGALAIGVDGAPQQGIPIDLSNDVKVHIAEQLATSVSYSLLLHNSGDVGASTTGTGVGILFSSDRFNDGKGALIFERRGAYGVGDFHFLQNNVGARQAPNLAADKAFTITREKDIRLYGGIDIDGTGAGTGFGTSGQVLSSTGTGVQWVTNGSSSVTDMDPDDGLSNYDSATGYDIQVDNVTLEISALDQLQIKDGGVTGGAGGVILDNSITASDLAPDSVDKSEIRVDAVGSSEIEDASILAEDLSDMGATTNGQVLKWNGTSWAPGVDAGGTAYTAGTGLSLSGANEFSVDNLAGDVTGPTGTNVIANNAVNSAKIADFSIQTSDLADSSVTTDKIDEDAVTGIELANNAVVSGNISDGTIMNVDVNGSAAIDGSKINPDFGAQNIVTTGNLDIGGSVTVGGVVEHPDYVFEKYFLGTSNLKLDYNFASLEEIEAFIKKHYHLPGIKSAAEVKKTGSWNLSESNIQNLEKIEELFLHTIDQEHKIKALQSENDSLSKELKSIQEDLKEIKALLKSK